MSATHSRAQRRAAARRARRLLGGGVAAGLVALGACSATHSPGQDRSRPADAGRDAGFGPDAEDGGAARDAMPSAPRPAPIDCAAPDRADLLRGDAVSNGTFTRDVLYSWTSQRQVAELRADPVLLTRSENSNGDRTQLSEVLSALALGGDPLAELLAGEAFARGRYAWTNAWAVRRGWPGESYGDQLLRIVLKPQAWIVSLRAQGFEVVDLNGQPVDVAAALAEPERIAGVYFVNEGEAGPDACGSFVRCATGAYREYFINNEQMIAQWSLGTPEILDEIERSIALVQSLLERTTSCPPKGADACELSRAAFCSWNDWPTETGDYADYVAALALTSEYYQPTSENMAALVASLQEALFTPDPLVHEP